MYGYYPLYISQSITSFHWKSNNTLLSNLVMDVVFETTLTLKELISGHTILCARSTKQRNSIAFFGNSAKVAGNNCSLIAMWYDLPI